MVTGNFGLAGPLDSARHRVAESQGVGRDVAKVGASKSFLLAHYRAEGGNVACRRDGRVVQLLNIDARFAVPCSMNCILA